MHPLMSDRPFLVWHLGKPQEAIAVDAYDEEDAVVQAGQKFNWNPDHLDTRPLRASDYTGLKERGNDSPGTP